MARTVYVPCGKDRVMLAWPAPLMVWAGVGVPLMTNVIEPVGTVLWPCTVAVSVTGWFGTPGLGLETTDTLVGSTTRSPDGADVLPLMRAVPPKTAVIEWTPWLRLLVVNRVTPFTLSLALPI